MMKIKRLLAIAKKLTVHLHHQHNPSSIEEIEAPSGLESSSKKMKAEGNELKQSITSCGRSATTTTWVKFQKPSLTKMHREEIDVLNDNHMNFMQEIIKHQFHIIG